MSLLRFGKKLSIRDFLIEKSIETGNIEVFENNIRESNYIDYPFKTELIKKLVENEDILNYYIFVSSPKMKKYIIEWIALYSDIGKINIDKLDSIDVSPECIASVIRQNKLVYLEKLNPETCEIVFHEDGELMSFHNTGNGIAFLKTHSLNTKKREKNDSTRIGKIINSNSKSGSVFFSTIIGYCVLLGNNEAFEFLRKKYTVEEEDLMMMINFGRFEMFEKCYTPIKDIPMYEIEYLHFNGREGYWYSVKMSTLLNEDEKFFNFVTSKFSEDEKKILKEWEGKKVVTFIEETK